MSLEKLRQLKRTWFPPEGGPFEDALNLAFDDIGFSSGLEHSGDESYLAASIAAHDAGRASRKQKVVKDNIWGMVELDWHSIRLLDCPLLQRLRGIRQLGFTYLTYPSAEHTRFTHSLGMYSVVRRFLDAIALRTKDNFDDNHGFRPWRPPEHVQIDLLHAAILHDIGHTPFSHVSEKIFEAHPSSFLCGPYTIEEFRFAVSENLEKDLSLSECLAVAIVLSPRFSDYYSRYVRPGTGDPDIPLRLAALIAGLAPDEKLYGVAALISGSPVDADKIDYVVRDASACGIPTGIDVARLFLRSAFLEVRQDVLAKLYATEESAPPQDTVVFILNASGVDTVEELTQARAALYQRVYLHQTTRNAERLLGLCFERIRQRRERQRGHNLRNALAIWRFDDFALLRELAKHNDRHVRRVGSWVRNRDLPKRACVITKGLVTTLMPIASVFGGLPTRTELFREIAGVPLDRLRSALPGEGEYGIDGEARQKFEADIAEEAAHIARTVRNVAPEHSPADDRPPLVTFLPLPALEEQRQDCIVLENNDLVHSTLQSVSDEQSEAADIFKSIGHVLASPDWRVFVFLATRTVLYKRTTSTLPTLLRPYSAEDSPAYHIRCVGRVMLDLHPAMRRASLNPKSVFAVQQAAESAGYFDDTPHLASEPNDPRIRTIAHGLRDFSGQGDWRVSTESCRTFLAQFPPRYRAEAVDLLEKIIYLGRDTIAADLKTAIGKLTEARAQGRLFITGFSPDSGSFVRMLLEHELLAELSGEGLTVVKSVHDVFALASPGDTVIFCDDNSVSGSQAECQFLAWLGVPREKWARDQQGERGIYDRPLADRDQRLLAAMRIGLAMCVGTEEAESRLQRRLPSLNLSSYLGMAYARTPQPPEIQLSSEMRSFLIDVGMDLLATCRYEADSGAISLGERERDDCAANALGYGNEGGLVVTKFNVPVSTITALWCPGFFQRRPWMPLLLRRGYLQHLVLS